MPFRVILTITAGPHQGDTFTFVEHDTFLVGRSPEAHFSLPQDPYFSRLHFLIEVNPPLCRLMDLKSHNKTYLNGQPVSTVDLSSGDEIRAGHTILRVGIEQADPAIAPTLTNFGALPPPPITGTTPSLHSRVQLTSPQPATPGTPLIPGYRIEKKLGFGGMGIVWLARQEKDNTPAALKTIRPAAVSDSVTVQRFLREAAILQKLDHPNIVRYRGQGEADGLLFFVMDYIPGTDAAQVLKEIGPLPIPRAVNLVCQMLEGLAYAHNLGFVHRDIKPANLLVSEEDGKEVARLADFGLARAYQASPLSGLTITGASGGTPAYMAPEQVRCFREVTPAADQYSAAATLFTLLTGRMVHGTATSMEEMFKRILLEDAEPLEKHRPDVSAPLALLVHRALAKEPKARYPDVQTLRAHLAGLPKSR